MKRSFLSLVALAVVMVACNKDEPNDSKTTHFGHVETMEDLRVPSSFNWRTAKNITANINVESVTGAPMSGIRVDYYSENPEQGGELISSGFTDASGALQQELKVDAFLDELYVIAHAGGISNMKYVQIAGENLNVDFGGPIARTYKKGAAGSPTPIPGFSNLYALGTWQTDGTPNYLLPPKQSLDSIQDCATKLMAALPEYQSVPCNALRKHLVNEGVQTELVVTGKSDVWVTFIDEGATIPNALGFHYYHPDSLSGPYAKPGNPSVIDSIFVIFPRVNEDNGILVAGDRVYLGNFPKGTHISWVLLQGAFNKQNGTLKNTFDEFFSIDALNDDAGNSCAGANFDRHVVSLKKKLDGDSVIVFSFEDLTFPGGDFDFNDAIWFVDGDSISCKKVPGLVTTGDRDKDGIDDSWDDYPDNPFRACDLRYNGTLAFEDLWPNKGDYDMNDHVIYYDVIQTISGSMKVIEIDGSWTLKANGAGFNNGFGFKLGSASKTSVASVSGTSLTGGYPTEANGLEASPTTEAVVLVWDQAKNEIPGNPVFFNTQGAPRPYIPFNVEVLFDSTGTLPSMMSVGTAPYNAFIVANQNRAKEIHLVDMAPTDIAYAAGIGALLGTQDDASGGGDFFQTATNLPWALDIKYAWEWPKERVSIIDAYSDFAAWAMSGGVSFPGWYLTPDPSKVYP